MCGSGGVLENKLELVSVVSMGFGRFAHFMDESLFQGVPESRSIGLSKG